MKSYSQEMFLYVVVGSEKFSYVFRKWVYFDGLANKVFVEAALK